MARRARMHDSLNTLRSRSNFLLTVGPASLNKFADMKMSGGGEYTAREVASSSNY